MDYFLIGAVGWLALFALWGLFIGFWRALAGAVSLVLAYWVSVRFAAVLAERFSLNLNATVAWLLWATILFVVVGFVARRLLMLLAQRLPIGSGVVNRLGGGLVNTAYGAVLGVVMVWGIAFLAESWNIRAQRTGAADTQRFDTSSPVVRWSRQMLGQWAAWQSGASESGTFGGLSVAMAENPGAVLAEVRTAVQSPEFRELSGSGSVREMVRRQDTEALRQSAEFQQFLQQPAVRQLRDRIKPHGAAWSDAQIAQEFVSAWGRMEQIKSRPEVMDILNDPEWQAFLRGEGGLTPSLLTRGQKLLALMGEGSAMAPAEPAPELFQWYDDNGQLHVTDFEAIPDAKKSAARAVEF